MLISYVFRGEEVDIDVTDMREPYEWLFCGVKPEDHDALKVTSTEEEEINTRIHEVLYDRAASWCPEDDR